MGRGRIFVDIDILEAELKTEGQENKAKQAEIYEQYQKEHNPEILFVGQLSKRKNA